MSGCKIFMQKGFGKGTFLKNLVEIAFLMINQISINLYNISCRLQNKLKQLNFTSEEVMAARRKGFDYVQSSKDKCLYSFVYYLTEGQAFPTFSINFIAHQLLKKNQSVVTVTNGENEKQVLKMPFSGVAVSICEINEKTQKSKRIQLFSVRLCQHIPVNILQSLKTKIDSPQKSVSRITDNFSKPLINTRQVCGYCEEPIWSYYSTQQTPLTYRQFTDVFEGLQLQRMQWNVILNESFTRNTRLATYDDEEFVLNFSGKVSYLENIKKFEDSSEIDDDHIFMKVKKIICKHEKIIDKMCQYCLTTLSDEELKSFRMYLFQVVNDSMIRNSFVGGKTLEQEENLFVNMVRQRKKAILILDIDNTILHSIEKWKISEQIINQIDDYIIIPEIDPMFEMECKFEKTIAKIRPFFEVFLDRIIGLYEIFIYTKGTRIYAEQICKAIRNKYENILSDTIYFTPNTIISRDEDPIINSKSMNHILPTKTQLITILDDRRDVWGYSFQCIYTKQYYYFFRASQANPNSDLKLQAIKWENGGGSLVSNSSEEDPQKKNKPEKDLAIITNGDEVSQKQQQLVIQNKNEGKQQKQKENEVQKQKQEKGLKEQKEEEIKKENAQLIINSTEKDYFLVFATETLKNLHSVYFEKLSEKPTQIPNMKTIHLDYRKSILKGLSAILFIPNIKQNQIFKRSITLGLNILENVNQVEPNIIIRCNDFQSLSNPTVYVKKLKYFSQTKQIPIVSQNWIDLCYKYTYRFDYKLFLVQNPCRTVIYSEEEKNQQKQTLTRALEQEVKRLLS